MKNHVERVVLCDYCGYRAKLVTGRTIYPHRPDLYKKWFYRCDGCDAHVGCHPKSKRPLGRLANGDLRRAKGRAHAAFDPLWKSGRMTRRQAYQWLASQLGITSDQCHIGMFDLELCWKTIRACSSLQKEADHAG